jgi:hypothetical protein
MRKFRCVQIMPPNNRLLPVLALFGHAVVPGRCLLPGVDRTCGSCRSTSEFDPKETLMPRFDRPLRLARATKTVQSSERSPDSMRWISRSRKEGTTSPRTTKVRTMGKYGFMAAVSSASDMPASCAYSDCAAALVARGRSGGHGRQSAAEGRAQAQAGRVRRAEEPGSQANQTSG